MYYARMKCGGFTTVGKFRDKEHCERYCDSNSYSATRISRSDWEKERTSPDEFKQKMLAISNGMDIEENHSCADNLIAHILVELGFSDGVEVFEDMEKWYA